MPVALVDTPIAQALGLTLAHFLWEGAAIAALLAVTLLLVRPASARVRYALACAALGAMLASFGATLAILWPAATPALVASGAPAAVLAGDGAIPFQPDAARTDLSWIVPFWAAGVLIFYVRAAGGWFAAQRLFRKGSIAASPEWQQRLRDLAARLRVTRPAVLLESCLAESPVVIGFLRPAILVPVGLLTGLTPKQLESILLHELAHIRRYDYAVNVMQSLIEGLLFYHPAVWWISGVARAERENCCDDAVVSAVGDARGYAAALAALEELRAAGEPALAATGGNLMKRIRRLLEPGRPQSIAGPLLGSTALVITVAAGLLAWQPQRERPLSPMTAQGKGQPEEQLRKELASPQRSEGTLRQLIQADERLRKELASPQRSEGTLRQLIQAEQRLRQELATPYRKWVDEDVAYIISADEKQAFERLQSDEEREMFIEQFWKRRDPTPGTIENEFKVEHYRRIAYANERFAEGAPGWKTDRGRIYVTFGPPDEIEDHVDRQAWRYRSIPGLGENVVWGFAKDGQGRFHLTVQPPRAAMPER